MGRTVLAAALVALLALHLPSVSSSIQASAAHRLLAGAVICTAEGIRHLPPPDDGRESGHDPCAMCVVHGAAPFIPSRAVALPPPTERGGADPPFLVRDLPPGAPVRSGSARSPPVCRTPTAAA